MKKILFATLMMTSLCALAAKQPNIVLIYSDDHGWGDVGYHGYKDILTPNIDKLAKGGTQFSQGYVSASVCGPSRAGVLTGVYQQRMGVYGNYDKGGIPTSQPMIFEMLKKKGYQTAAIGKWHVGGAREEQRPNSRGVDFFYGFLYGAHDYYKSTTNPEYKKASELPIMRNTRIEPPIQDSNGYLTEMFTKEAVEYIERTDSNKPFFVYLSYNAVHHPWDVPQPYIDRVQGLDTHDERKLFAGMALCMDDGVGAVMKALENKGVVDNTLVVFMSDNGSPRGQGIAQPKQKTRGQCTMSNPGPFNGFKGDTYEGGIRVPMVMHWPGKIPAGKTYDKPVINLDLAATFMALNGVSNPWKGFKFDGVDLLPYITGKNDGLPHDVLYWRRGDDYAIRKGDWKLAWNDAKDGSGTELIELFNLADDPGEWKDLAGSQPERAQALQDMFDAWDSKLADNQTGKNAANRNTGYASGKRINVAKFNAGVTGEKSEDTKSKKQEKELKKSAKSAPAVDGVSLEEKLKQAEARAKELGKKFDAEQTTRWFNSKDSNKDGVLDDAELKAKAPVDWNKEPVPNAEKEPKTKTSLSRKIPPVVTSATAATGSPNIIFILSDDHAPTAIGCYGKRLSPFAKTPNIDRLAAEGVRLDGMYCVNAICGPSRASIISGQYGHVNGVTGNGKIFSREHPNVAKELGALGYQTAVIGKWHLNERPAGFTYYEVLKGQGQYFSPRLYGPEDGDGKTDGTVYTDRYSADVISERAVEWLKNRDKTKPFVLMSHFKACHGPRSFPERVAHLYKDVLLPEPATLFEDESVRCDGRKGLGLTMSGTAVQRFSQEDWATGSIDFSGMNPDEQRRAAHQKMNKDYLRVTAALDEGIGNILEYADKTGLMDNTVIIYSSDQGYYLGEHNYIDKRWFFEEGVNMPFVVRYPKLFKPGTVNEDIMLNIDIAPFLLELAGGKTPEYMQGRSFAANLQGRTPSDWRKAYYYHYWDQNNRPAHYGIQTKDYRLIFFYGLNLDRKLAEMLPWAVENKKQIKTTKPTGYGWELYDLKKDSLESRNVYDNPEYKEVITKLVAEMDAHKQKIGDTDELFPELVKRRKASGN